MTTVVQDGDFVQARKSEPTRLGKIVPVALAAWVVLGPTIGVWLANQVIIDEWRQSAAQSLSYSAHVLHDYSAGVILWFIVLVVLGILTWRAHPSP